MIMNVNINKRRMVCCVRRMQGDEEERGERVFEASGGLTEESKGDFNAPSLASSRPVHLPSSISLLTFSSSRYFRSLDTIQFKCPRESLYYRIIH